MNNIENIKVRAGYKENYFVISWRHNDLRYHFTVDGDLQPTGNTIYKNPPQELNRYDEGYFYTRKLRLEKHANLVAGICHYVRTNDLVAKALEEQRLREENDRAEAKRRDMEYFIKTIREYADTIIYPLAKASDEQIAGAINDAIIALWRKNHD